MAENNGSAEFELLKAIEGGGAQEKPSGGEAVPEKGGKTESSSTPGTSKERSAGVSPKETGKGFLRPVKPSGEIAAPLKDIVGSVSGKVKELSEKALKSGKFSLKDINRILAIIVLALIVIQSVVLVKGFADMGNMPRFDEARVAGQDLDAPHPIRPLKSHAYYVEAFLGRNIFLEQEARVTAAEAPRRDAVRDMMRDLRLTGLIWFEDTGEVFTMIEDTSMNITHYLQEMERIKGFTVKSIGSNRVILEKNGMEMELR